MSEQEVKDQLNKLQKQLGNTFLRDEFTNDPDRASKYAKQIGNITIDYSKHYLNQDIMSALFELAKEKNITEKIPDIFNGKKINNTEHRSVLHPALRAETTDTIFPVSAVKEVHNTLDKMNEFAAKVISGEWKGYTGKSIDTVVNIGIGGSDLGPSMITTALADFHLPHIKSYFVSNIDPSDINHVLKTANPETTLFVIVSKTFTTIETLTNAKQAKDWFLKHSDNNTTAVAKHFVAVSTNSEKVTEFGISTQQMFEFWDWVGGRFSTDSAVGLSIMIAIGVDNFQNLLAGFRTADVHFLNNTIETNLPVILALIEYWYNNYFNFTTRAILPYSQHLQLLPAYLQQLMMESNGKSVTKSGKKVTENTGEIIWGAPGTNGQHAFYQLLHQGTAIVPSDFIGVAYNPDNLTLDDNSATLQDLLFSNLMAQSKVLAFGKNEAELAAEGVAKELIPHKVMPGNRPSSTILLPELNPFNLGTLIALYEHQVYIYGLLTDINSFDQWGVELGKQEAKSLLPSITSNLNSINELDSSTSLIATWYVEQDK